MSFWSARDIVVWEYFLQARNVTRSREAKDDQDLAGTHEQVSCQVIFVNNTVLCCFHETWTGEDLQ